MADTGMFKRNAPTGVSWVQIADSLFYHRYPDKGWKPRRSMVKIASQVDHKNPQPYDVSLIVDGNVRLKLTDEGARAMAEALILAADARRRYVEERGDDAANND